MRDIMPSGRQGECPAPEQAPLVSYVHLYQRHQNDRKVIHVGEGFVQSLCVCVFLKVAVLGEFNDMRTFRY